MKTHIIKTRDELTIREIEIINFIAHEFTTSEIAAKLFLSTETIKTYRRIIQSKLNVTNMAGIVREGCHRGLVQNKSMFRIVTSA